MALPDYQGITVKVGTVSIGELLSLDSVIDKTRAVKKYNPINSDNQIIATGALVQGSMSMSILYDPSAVEGVNALETAIDTDSEVAIVIEMNDSAGANGTTITRTCRVTAFKVVGEDEGKYKADVSFETVGTPAISAAA
ncbi:MAG: hypothetical protein JKY28_02685 [Sulfurimonas sp.]|nr:hypothetical protein [Sulfurimonas sp.]